MSPTNHLPPASAVPAPVPTEADRLLFSKITAIIQGANPVASFREDCCHLIAAHVAAVSRVAVENTEAKWKAYAEHEFSKLAGVAAERLEMATEARRRAEKAEAERDANASVLARVREKLDAARNHNAYWVGRTEKAEIDLARVREELEERIFDEEACSDKLTAERAAHAETKRILKVVVNRREIDGAAHIAMHRELEETEAGYQRAREELSEANKQLSEARDQLDQARAFGGRQQQEADLFARQLQDSQATATRHADLAKEMAEALDEIRIHAIEVYAERCSSSHVKRIAAAALTRYNEAMKEGKAS
jgi:hypothetical protein